MKRSLWTAVLAAGVLLVTGCSSNNAGTGSAASTTAASSASSSAAAGSESMTSESASSSEAMSSESASSGSGGSGSASASVAPATLDAQTTAWFTTLCKGVAPTLSEVQTNAQTASTPQQLSDALKKFGSGLSDTATELKSTPAPTFDAGTDFANRVTSGLAESGPKLSALAQKVGAIKATDTAALKEALSSLPTEVQAAIQPLQSVGQLPPAVSAAVQEIPACKALGS